MINKTQNTPESFSDLIKNWLKETWYFSKLQQKLFGNISSIEEFIEMTKGEIKIQSEIGLVAPPSVSIYPFEIYIKYTAEHNKILILKFSEQLKHYELIEKITKEEYLAITKESLAEKLNFLAQHRKKRIEIKYNRDAIADWKI